MDQPASLDADVLAGPGDDTRFTRVGGGMGRAAVVGGGLFGASAAIALAEAGWQVQLFERRTDILQGASAKNLLRLHSGYHYPRSRSTGAESLAARGDFLEWYSPALGPVAPHYYAIAREGSLTSAEQFLDHCTALGLPWTDERSSLLRPDSTSLCIRADERVIDVASLRRLCRDRLDAAGVHVTTSSKPSSSVLDGFDLRVISTYGDNGDVIGELGFRPQPLQLEVCEVATIRVERAPQQSLVVMDGPFISLTPIGGDRFLLYHVDHSIHLRKTAAVVAPSEWLRDVCRDGWVASPAVSNVGSMLDAAQEFIEFPSPPDHLGSSYTVRPVLPDVDHTDERPTILDWLDPRTVAVLSGKLGTCVTSAKEIVRVAYLLEPTSGRPSAEPAT